MAEEQYKRPSGNANMFYGSSPAGTGAKIPQAKAIRDMMV